MTLETAWLVRLGDLWWCPDRCGYASGVLYAGVYTEKEAKAIERSSDRGDRAVKLTDAMPGVRHGSVAALLGCPANTPEAGRVLPKGRVKR